MEYKTPREAALAGDSEVLDEMQLDILRQIEEARKKGDSKEERRLLSLAKDGWRANADFYFNKARAEYRSQLRHMTDGKLEEESNNRHARLLYWDLIEEEIAARSRDQQKRDAKREEENKVALYRTALIDFDQIVKLITTCFESDIPDFEMNNITFRGNQYEVKKENGTLSACCSDGRKLSLTYNYTFEEKSLGFDRWVEHFYDFNLTYTKNYKSISFRASSNQYFSNLRDLIRVVRPATLKGDSLSWKQVPKFNDVMFINSELALINDILSIFYTMALFSPYDTKDVLLSFEAYGAKRKAKK